MMEKLDFVTFKDIYTHVLRRVKADVNDSENLLKAKEMINLVYRTICNRKKWKFLRETKRSIRWRKPHTDGLVSLDLDSRSIRGIATFFESKHENWLLKINGLDTIFRVVSVPSSVSLLLNVENAEVAVTNASYKLFQAEIALFPDLEDIDDVKVDGQIRKPDPTGPAVINELRQRYPERDGPPLKYSIEGTAPFPGTNLEDFILSFDFLGSGFEAKAMSMFPQISDKDYILHLPYKKQVTALAEDADEPLIPIEHRVILFYLVLSEWYAASDTDLAKYYQKLGKDELNVMMTKFLDTDDIIRLYPKSLGGFSHNYLLSHSGSYFDREG